MKKSKSKFLKNICLLLLSIAVTFVICPISSFATEVASSGAVVMISSYEVSGDSIIPGEEFEFIVSLKNTDSIYWARNVLIDISTVDGINTVYPSMPQIYVGDMGPGTEQTISFQYKASSYYSVDTVPFYVTVTTDSRVNSVLLSAPVTIDDSPFVVMSKNIPDVAGVGEGISSSVYFKTKDENNLSNISMRVLVDGEEAGSSLIGNMYAGASKTQNISFYIYEEGIHSVAFELEGVDQNGELQTMTVYEGKIDVVYRIPTNSGDNEMKIDSATRRRNKIKIVACFGAIALCTASIVFVVRKNN